MKFSELVRLLEQNGFRLAKENKGRRFYRNDATGRVILLHHHPGKEVPTGTLHQILKDAGLK